jgi:hypothetical protein
VRLQLELLKPEMAFAENNVDSTIVVFGSTQIVERTAAPNSAQSGPRPRGVDPPERRAPSASLSWPSERVGQGPLLRGGPRIHPLVSESAVRRPRVCRRHRWQAGHHGSGNRSARRARQVGRQTSC